MTLILVIIVPLFPESMIANQINSKMNTSVPFPVHSNLLLLA